MVNLIHMLDDYKFVLVKPVTVNMPLVAQHVSSCTICRIYDECPFFISCGRYWVGGSTQSFTKFVLKYFLNVGNAESFSVKSFQCFPCVPVLHGYMNGKVATYQTVTSSGSTERPCQEHIADVSLSYDHIVYEVPVTAQVNSDARVLPNIDLEVSVRSTRHRTDVSTSLCSFDRCQWISIRLR